MLSIDMTITTQGIVWFFEVLQGGEGGLRRREVLQGK